MNASKRGLIWFLFLIVGFAFMAPAIATGNYLFSTGTLFYPETNDLPAGANYTQFFIAPSAGAVSDIQIFYYGGFIDNYQNFLWVKNPDTSLFCFGNWSVASGGGTGYHALNMSCAGAQMVAGANYTLIFDRSDYSGGANMPVKAISATDYLLDFFGTAVSNFQLDTIGGNSENFLTVGTNQYGFAGEIVAFNQSYNLTEINFSFVNSTSMYSGCNGLVAYCENVSRCLDSYYISNPDYSHIFNTASSFPISQGSSGTWANLSLNPIPVNTSNWFIGVRCFSVFGGGKIYFNQSAISSYSFGSGAVACAYSNCGAVLTGDVRVVMNAQAPVTTTTISSTTTTTPVGSNYYDMDFARDVGGFLTNMTNPLMWFIIIVVGIVAVLTLIFSTWSF